MRQMMIFELKPLARSQHLFAVNGQILDLTLMSNTPLCSCCTQGDYIRYYCGVIRMLGFQRQRQNMLFFSLVLFVIFTYSTLEIFRWKQYLYNFVLLQQGVYPYGLVPRRKCSLFHGRLGFLYAVDISDVQGVPAIIIEQIKRVSS